MANKTAKMAIGLAVATAIGMVFMGPVTTVVADNTGDVTVTNESVTVQHGTYVELGGYDIDPSSETVYNSSGATMTEGSDYEMAYGNGSIKALSSGSLGDGSTANVTYTYAATGPMAGTIAQFIPVMLAVLIFVGIAGPIMKKV